MKRRPAGGARIAFFDAYALIEGAELALLELIERMDRDRFEPVALLPREGPVAERLERAGCPVDVLPPGPPLDNYGGRLAQGGVGRKLRAAFGLARYSRRVARWLRENEVDLLHCNQTRAAVMAGPGARRAGVPVLWNVRIHERMPGSVVRLAELCSSVIVPLTDDIFRGLRAERRLMSRSTVIRNAIDIERFGGRNGRAVRHELKIAADVPVIVSAGVLVERKGFGVLVRAMPAIRERLPRARLLIAGGLPDGLDNCADELREMIAELGLEDVVTLLGRRDDMPDLLSACDVFVLASRYEGDPAVVLEAMASALPVVVTPDAGAAVEDGETGLVVPRDDVYAVAEAVCELVETPALAERLAGAARARVEQNHEIGAMVAAYEDAWESTLEGAT